MIITVVSTLMLMLGYFLMLYGAVGFIQDKRLFSSAPKENLAVIDLMGGVLHRTGTIAAGAEMCDFYVCKKGSEWDIRSNG